MIRGGFSSYFESMWNYSDIAGFILLYVTTFIGMFTTGMNGDSMQLLLALTYTFLILRGMSYLRIFSNLRYLINMVIEILKDMTSFMYLLIYWILGFSLIFFLFSFNPTNENVLSGETDGFKEFIVSLTKTY